MASKQDHELLIAAIKQLKEKMEEKFEEQMVRAEKMGATLESLGSKIANLEKQLKLEKVERPTTRSLASQSEPCESRKFKLQFQGTFAETLYAENEVQAPGHPPIKLLLVDAITGHQVTDQLSSKEVKFVLLPGDFEPKNWTQQEFDANILSRRANKKDLLGEKDSVVLQDGMGSIEGITITDNSSWQKSSKFRIGAIVKGCQDQVMEAVSSAIQVKDRRGEKCQKHQIPSSKDEVWRLEGIGKEICKRLADDKIYKVEDLVAKSNHHESKLRQILNVGDKKYKKIIQQARNSINSSECTNRLNDSTPIDTPTSSWGVQGYHMTTRAHDQQANPMFYNFDNHQFYQSMDQRDLLHGNELCNDVDLSSLDHFFPSMPNRETSSSLLMGGDNYYIGCSSNSDIGNVSAGVDNSKNKEDHIRTRAVWDVSAERDEAALKKGKFQRQS